MTIKELINNIHESEKAIDLNGSFTSDANTAIIKEKCSGTFEVMQSEDGGVKNLVPNNPALFFLFRGQNEEYNPCYPSIYRKGETDIDIVINRLKIEAFRYLIESHPVVNKVFRKLGFFVDVEGLAQHYGLKTSVLDLTSDLDTALFFATCKYNGKDYDFFDDNLTHNGVMYLFRPIFDNEPIPLQDYRKFMQSNIRPIGMQPFLRPAAQNGFALHIEKGQSLKCYIYRFTFTSEDSKYYYDKFNEGRQLWIKDELISKVDKIKNLTCFSFEDLKNVFSKEKKLALSHSKIKKLLKEKGISFYKTPQRVIFTENECQRIIEDWNESKGKDFAQKIVSKYNYDFESIDEGTGKIQGIKNYRDNRCYGQSCLMHILSLIKNPNAPINSEWVNYTNQPAPKVKLSKKLGEVQRIPPSMESVFGKPFLKEEDWKIQNINR